MPSRATLIADALRPKKAPDAPDVFSAPKQSWADYVGAAPATGYEGMPAPQAEGMPEHDPNGTVSRIANALATMPSVQGVRDAITAPVDAYQGKFDPTSDEGIGRALGMAGMAMTSGVAGTGAGGVALGSGPIPRYLHGTLADNVPSIRENGLVPGTSNYTRRFYGEDIPEALFLAPENDPKRAFSSIRGQIADKLGKHPAEVTQKEIKEHGALILAREDPHEVYKYDDGQAKNSKGGYTDDIPPQAEPSDYFSTADIPPTGILKGERLAKYLEKQKLLEGVTLGSGATDKPSAAMLGQALLGNREPIRAYHGSPHDFDKFDLSKIGTGEGAQAYGHGLYMAENEAVARGYRDALSRHPAQAFLDRHSGDIDAAITAAKREANTAEGRMNPDLVPLLEAYKSGQPLPEGKGSMYEVAIHADPERFLDWDKPLSEQPQIGPAIEEVAPDYAAAMKNDRWIADRQAGTLVKSLGENLPPDQVSAALREAGIPGIKYLDQGSRKGATGIASQDIAERILDAVGGDHAKAVAEAESRLSTAQMPTPELNDALGLLKSGWKPDRTSNYVLFDDKIVEILRKYGVGSIAALPPAVQMAIQLHQDQTQAEPQEPTFAGKASKMINDLQRKLRGPEPPATPLGMGIRG